MGKHIIYSIITQNKIKQNKLEYSIFWLYHSRGKRGLLKNKVPVHQPNNFFLSIFRTDRDTVALNYNVLTTIASYTLVSKLSLCSTMRLSLCRNGCEKSFASVSVIAVFDNWGCSGHGKLLQAIQRELWPQGAHHRRRAPDAHLRRNSLPPCHSWGYSIIPLPLLSFRISLLSMLCFFFFFVFLLN